MTDPRPATAPLPPLPGALWQTVAEIERHVARDGWGSPVRLFALVRTADAIERDPALADRLPPDLVEAAEADPTHLTSVEQEGVPADADLDELLARLAWPPSVHGAAVVVESVLVPPDAEAEVRAGTPTEDGARLAALTAHPLAEDVRIAVGVLRDGRHECVVRSRSKDRDTDVATGADLVPGLVSALQATLGD